MALAAQRARADGTDARTRLLEIIRKKSLLRGTFKLVSGAVSNYYLDIKPNSTVVLIEDVTTKGGSVMQAVNAVRAQGATVKKIITIVDRLEGAEENLRKEGLALAPIFTTKDLLG